MPREHLSAVPDHFQWIDALRGSAALVIVVFHYHHFYLADHTDRANIPATSEFPYAILLQPMFEHGFWAVELFWVISGFVFSHVYLPRAASLRQYVTARIARLYPLHVVTLLFVLGVQVLSITATGHWQIYGNNDLRHFILNLFMASNLTNQSYGLSFNGPIWSVSLELAAYAFFFLALAGVRRAPIALPIICCGMSFVIGSSEFDLPLLRKHIFVCTGYFFAGATLYGICRRLNWQMGSILTLALTTTALAMVGWGVLGESLRAILVSVALITCLVACDLRLPAIGRRLRPLGDISYSVYLVHVPLQMCLLLVADLFLDGTRAFADRYWLMPVYVAASLALALAAHLLIEKPIGTWLRSKLGQRRN